MGRVPPPLGGGGLDGRWVHRGTSGAPCRWMPRGLKLPSYLSHAAGRGQLAIVTVAITLEENVREGVCGYESGE